MCAWPEYNRCPTCSRKSLPVDLSVSKQDEPTEDALALVTRHHFAFNDFLLNRKHRFRVEYLL